MYKPECKKYTHSTLDSNSNLASAHNSMQIHTNTDEYKHTCTHTHSHTNVYRYSIIILPVPSVTHLDRKSKFEGTHNVVLLIAIELHCCYLLL